MKKIILGAVLIFVGGVGAHAQEYGYGSNSNGHYVQGYERNNGTYVQPHYQSNPNSTTYDNYGTRGNVNPYTGATGTRNPY
ncbi:hypothetical protein [Rhodoblastus sp.]|uniref:hypothetical protein n=1 Tax=Rhodoblastus sp. TaxID=1962975 RepID=UPI0035AFDE32